MTVKNKPHDVKCEDICKESIVFITALSKIKLEETTEIEWFSLYKSTVKPKLSQTLLTITAQYFVAVHVL